MLRAYKYRIYPNDEQRSLIEQTFGCCRLVYNLGLQIKIDTYKKTGVSVSGYTLGLQIKDLKKECEWVGNVSSQSLYASLNNIDGAFDSFFKGGGFPKFKSKGGKQSFQCRNARRRVDFEKQLLTRTTDIRFEALR